MTTSRTPCAFLFTPTSSQGMPVSAHGVFPSEKLMLIDIKKFRPDFADWLRPNFNIWLSFVKEANKAWNRGRRHYSARTIIEYLRHETALRENEGEFKVNGNYVPDLARLYQFTFPERAALFETRLPRNSARSA